jgi:nucleoside triphosphatase
VVVVPLIQNDRKQYLICKKPKSLGVFPGQWGLPGGGIEANETMEAALRREIREEVGLEVYDIEPLFFTDGLYPKYYANGSQQPIYMIFLVFSCRATSDDVKLNREFEAYAWVDRLALRGYDLNSATLETFRRVGALHEGRIDFGMAASNPLLPARWATPRLSVEDSTLAEAAELQQVYDACVYIEAWTGPLSESQHAQPMLWALQEGDLPPSGSKEFFRLQSIRLKATHQLIGFTEVYHGYPTADIFWVGFLGILPDFQNQGYGREAIQGLIETVAGLNIYSAIRLGVALKNWPALRFWTGAGFNRIVEMRGDKVYSDQSFAFVFLERRLEGAQP